MQIREYGEVVLCKNITFEDNKYDLEGGHPGIVILPTTENDNEVCCLYMTSDSNRVKREKDKYIKNNARTVKDSYINLQQIIKIINNKDREVSLLRQKDFVEVLESFYNYQMNLEPPKQDFLDIKEKVKTLLDLLKINERLEIDTSISAEMLNDLMKIKDSEKRKKIYATKLATLPDIDMDKIEEECFKDARERNYYNKLMELNAALKGIDFNEVDFNDLNNEVRNLYLDTRNRNFLMNADLLFNDVIFLVEDDTAKSGLKIFLQKERERLELKKKVEEEKKEAKLGKAEAKKKRAARYNEKNRFRRSISKYGNSEFFK